MHFSTMVSFPGGINHKAPRTDHRPQTNGQINDTDLPNRMFLDCGRNPDSQEEAHIIWEDAKATQQTNSKATVLTFITTQKLLCYRSILLSVSFGAFLSSLWEISLSTSFNCKRSLSFNMRARTGLLPTLFLQKAIDCWHTPALKCTVSNPYGI